VFELSPEKIFIVFAAAMVFLGPRELPGAARSLARGLRQLTSLRDQAHAEISSMLDPDAHSQPEVVAGTSPSGAEPPSAPASITTTQSSFD
jgi:Sec-independent protein translocase protein TatA